MGTAYDTVFESQAFILQCHVSTEPCFHGNEPVCRYMPWFDMLQEKHI